MNRLWEGFRRVPGVAKLVAVASYTGLAWVLLEFGIPHDPKMRYWSPLQKNLFAFLIPLLLLVFIPLVGYVYADAKRREMRHVMWTLLALFVPNALGIILYFLLRDPLPAPCSSCGVVVRGVYTFCPHCGTALKPTCPRCGRAVERAWGNCAYCGAKLGQPPSSAV